MQAWKRKSVVVAAGLMLAAALSACGWLDNKQKDWIFNVSDRSWGGYATGAHGFEDVFIPVGNSEKIHGWWAQARNETRAGANNTASTVLYLHGTRWNLSGSANRIQRWQERGFNVLAIDYRGFGQSSGGQPSEDKAYEDARSALAWLRANRPDTRGYVLVGHSLGGAVAIELAASEQNVKGLVTEATFTSMRGMAERTPARFLPLSLVLTQKFESIDKIDRVKVPTLIVHGKADSLVPVEMAHELFAKVKAPKEILIVDNGTHHNIGWVAGDAYNAALTRLLAGVTHLQ
jgi:uncharacterized protein